jgi:putative ABC transport system permease protein
MSPRELLLYAKISWRSILRNKRRTVLTMLGVIFGSMALTLFSGFLDGLFENLREFTIHSRLGHIQLTRPGYRDFGTMEPQKYSIDNFSELKEEFLKIEGVQFVTKRFEFYGLISNGDATVNFFATGAEADVDSKINTAIRYVEGQAPTSDKEGIAVGIGLARKLHLKVGDNVTLLVTYGGNSVNAVDADIIGIFESGTEAFDAVAINVPMPLTNTLLDTPDDAAHTVVVMLDETRRTDQVAGAIEAMARSKGWNLEVKTWDVLATVYHKVVNLFEAIFRFLRIVVVLIVVFSITNTITMSVYERFREIGSIRAIGTSRGNVTRLFLMEGAFIGLLGSVIGVLLANGPRVLLNSLDITLPPPPILTIGAPLFIKFNTQSMVQVVIGATALSIAASFFPARKAARTDIVAALRSV